MTILEKIATEIPSVIAIVLVVLWFLKAQKELIEKFMEIIKNHLHDHQTALDKNTTVLNRVEDFVKETLIYLKRTNGKK